MDGRIRILARAESARRHPERVGIAHGAWSLMAIEAEHIGGRRHSDESGNAGPCPAGRSHALIHAAASLAAGGAEIGSKGASRPTATLGCLRMTRSVGR